MLFETVSRVSNYSATQTMTKTDLNVEHLRVEAYVEYNKIHTKSTEPVVIQTTGFYYFFCYAAFYLSELLFIVRDKAMASSNVQARLHRLCRCKASHHREFQSKTANQAGECHCRNSPCL